MPLKVNKMMKLIKTNKIILKIKIKKNTKFNNNQINLKINNMLNKNK